LRGDRGAGFGEAATGRLFLVHTVHIWVPIPSQTRNAYTSSMDELTLDGETYVSSKRAAKLTGYAKDYVGQLCREGSVEAKKVGRSWYVLESSILEHRFGGGEEQEEVEAEERSAPSPVSDWERPSYTPEEQQLIPAMDQAVKEERAEVAKSIADMQTAWQEWFEQKGEPQEALLESPEVMDAREHEQEELYEEEDVAIPFKRIEEDPEPVEEEVEVEEIPIQKIVVPKEAPAPVAPPVTREHIVAAKQPVSVVAAAVLVAVALLVVALAYVGTGSAGRFLPDNPVLDFLGGKSEVDNTRL